MSLPSTHFPVPPDHKSTLSTILLRRGLLPDELVIVKEGGVFDQAEVLFHPVDKGLDLQVGHLVQWEEADAAEHIKQVT